MGSSAAVLLGLAAASARAGLVVADCGGSAVGFAGLFVLPGVLGSCLATGFPSPCGVLLFFNPGVPERFAQGVFLRGERLPRRLAPDVEIQLRPVCRPRSGAGAGSGAVKGVLVFVSYGYIKQGKGGPARTPPLRGCMRSHPALAKSPKSQA